MLTREMVEKSLPANLKSAATQQLTDQINNIVSDPLIAQQVRDNFISYSSVLKDGKFKTEDYLHAVAYAIEYRHIANGYLSHMTMPIGGIHLGRICQP